MVDNGAFQVTTAAAAYALPAGTRRVRLMNLGPNAVYAGTTAAKCTAALGMQIIVGTASLPPGVIEIDIMGHELYLIAASANQSSPADTRWYALG